MTDPTSRVTPPHTRPNLPAMDTHIRVEIMPMPRGRVSCEVCADGEVWGVTVENRAEAWAVAFSAVRGIVRTRRLRKLSALNSRATTGEGGV